MHTADQEWCDSPLPVGAAERFSYQEKLTEYVWCVHLIFKQKSKILRHKVPKKSQENCSHMRQLLRLACCGFLIYPCTANQTRQPAVSWSWQMDMIIGSVCWEDSHACKHMFCNPSAGAQAGWGMLITQSFSFFLWVYMLKTADLYLSVLDRAEHRFVPLSLGTEDNLQSCRLIRRIEEGWGICERRR